MGINSLQLSFGNEKEPTAPFLLFEHIIEDRGSRYSVSIGRVESREAVKEFLKALKTPKAYRDADHNSLAVRIKHEGVIFETKQDDGETGAGMVILRVMQKENVVNAVICVTRWFGGTKLMGDRFRHLQDATKYAITHL